jgi:hypothetical protein
MSVTFDIGVERCEDGRYSIARIEGTTHIQRDPASGALPEGLVELYRVTGPRVPEFPDAKLSAARKDRWFREYSVILQLLGRDAEHPSVERIR